ncbi:MAG: hypothetical protein U5K54_24675 [Cytophagales bacterium]|nr:hypothetical protein [Cytophagales bacterium]
MMSACFQKPDVPGVLNHYQEDHLMAITLPQGNYWAAPSDKDNKE